MKDSDSVINASLIIMLVVTAVSTIVMSNLSSSLKSDSAKTVQFAQANITNCTAHA